MTTTGDSSQHERRRILVTGGYGLLGSAILEHTQRVLQDRDTWYFVRSVDGDLRCPLETDLLFGRVMPTHVIHLAARVGGLFSNLEDNAGYLVDNCRININVLDACKRFGVKKVVSCLSTCVFPDGAPLPLTSAALHAGKPHDSNEGYAHSKRLLEVLSRHLSRQTGVPYVCVAPTNLYGPRDTFDVDHGHVIPALIRKACTEPVLRVRGTGEPKRQFLYAADAAALVVRALDEYDDVSKPLMLAPPPSDEVSIAGVASLIAELAGCEVEFDNDPSADGQYRKTVTCDTPDFHFTPLKTGLETTVAWYLASRYNDKKTRDVSITSKYDTSL